MTYEIWILGYNEDGTSNDFEQLEGTFEDSDKAIWFATHYEFTKPSITPKAKVVVEKVSYNSCIEVICETEI